MILKDDAMAIMAEVRDFYASGVKSGNKVYVTGVRSNRYIKNKDVFDEKYQGWSTTMLAEKAARRNENVLKSQHNRPQMHAGESFFDVGMRIYNGGKRAEFASGNCMEMAAVSAALAIATYRYAPDCVWGVMIDPPGDHAFCLLSEHAPQWPNVAAMTSDMGAPGAIVVDPWLNTVCEARGYWAAAQERVAAWSRKGKRIAWTGRYGDKFGWYDPSESYATAFGQGPLTFTPATQDL